MSVENEERALEHRAKPQGQRCEELPIPQSWSSETPSGWEVRCKNIRHISMQWPQNAEDKSK